MFGEDVGYFGGVFRCTEGLQRKYGKSRCFDAPINELRHRRRRDRHGRLRPAGRSPRSSSPTTSIPGYDQIVSEAARLRYRSGGEFFAPIVIRMPCGGGIYGGQTHSQSPEALFTHVSGLKTVIPSNPYDAKGLLIAAIEDDDPVIFLEPKRLYNGPFSGHPDQPVTPWSKHPLSEVPDGRYVVPLGKAAVAARGQGRDRAVLRHDGRMSPKPRPRRRASTPRSSTCARSFRSTSTRSSPRSRRPAAASSCTRRR